MKFGMDKCRILNKNRGKFETKGVELDQIDAMNEKTLYKYLGYEQALNIKHTKYEPNKACQSDLNSKIMFKMLKTFTIPTFTYSFSWRKTDSDVILRKKEE